VNALYSQHMLPCRPVNSILDLKRTKHKKLLPYLEEAESKGLLKLAHNDGVYTLVWINRFHDLYRVFTPVSTELACDVIPSDDTIEEAIKIYDCPFSVAEVYCCKRSALVEILQCRVERPEYWSAAQVKSAVMTYVNARALSGERESDVTLNAQLQDALQTLDIKIAKCDLLNRVLDQLVMQYDVRFCNSEREVLKTDLKPIEILLEHRQGGKKHTTRVTGLERFGINVGALSQYSSRQYATSASLQTITHGLKSEKELVLQGDVSDEITKLLTGEMSIPKKYINLTQRGKTR